MPSRNQILVIVGLVLVLTYLLLLIYGESPTVNLFKPIAGVAALLSLALFAFDQWVWKWPVLRGWLVKKPSLAGTWAVTLNTTHPDPVTGEQREPIEGCAVLRQTFFTFSLRLSTKESISELIASSIDVAEDGTITIAALYRNTPNVRIQDQSRIHHGAMLLRILSKPDPVINGHYWTDRGTRGDIRLTMRSREFIDDFDPTNGLTDDSGVGGQRQ